MNQRFLHRIKRLEKATFDGNSVWMVETDLEEHWQPYRVMVETGKEIERLDVMDSEQFFEWREKEGKQPILDIVGYGDV